MKLQKSNKKRASEHSQMQIQHLGPQVGLPDRLRLTVRAVERHNVALTDAISSIAIGCNTVAAPFITVSTGEVCQYYEWIKAAYDRAYVIRSRIHVQIINTTVSDSVLACLSFDGNTTISTNMNSLCELPHSQDKLIGYFAAGTNSATFTASYNPLKFQGFPYNSPENASDGLAEPTNPYYYILSLQSVAAGTGNMSVKVTVEYDVELTERISPPP